jgi:XrtJ-associated TM-motif-TM protein
MKMQTCLRLMTVAAVMMAVSVQMHAQTGCVDSPENPTAVLALVGVAGAVLAKFRRR